MNTREMTPGERRELRSLVKKQFTVLRADVKRRAEELKGEIESELLRQYRAQDEAIARAREAQQAAYSEYIAAVQAVGRELRLDRPELEVKVGTRYGQVELQAEDPNRGQVHRAAIAAIPEQISAASTKLDQDELALLRDLTVGALDTESATNLLDAIPTVGQLVPKGRLAAIEGLISPEK